MDFSMSSPARRATLSSLPNASASLAGEQDCTYFGSAENAPKVMGKASVVFVGT